MMAITRLWTYAYYSFSAAIVSPNSSVPNAYLRYNGSTWNPLDILDKVLRIFSSNGLDTADFAFIEKDAVELVRLSEHFRSEGRCDELRFVGQFMNHC